MARLRVEPLDVIRLRVTRRLAWTGVSKLFPHASRHCRHPSLLPGYSVETSRDAGAEAQYRGSYYNYWGRRLIQWRCGMLFEQGVMRSSFMDAGTRTTDDVHYQLQDRACWDIPMS